MEHPTLIILGGFAGAGKTTISKKLSADRNLPLVNTDELNDAVRSILKLDFKAASPIVYDLAWAMIKKYLENGVTVILDANMCNARTWENVDAIKATMPEVRVLPIILECSLETHKARIDHRGQYQLDHLNLGGDAFEDILFKYEYINGLERSDLIRVDSNPEIDVVYDAVIRQLDESR
jgi:predicted kinase